MDRNFLRSSSRHTYINYIFFFVEWTSLSNYYMTFGWNTTILEDGTIVPSVEVQILLGTTIDSHLTFYSHLKQLWKKVAIKLNTLTRTAPYLSHNQRWHIYSYSLTGQLSYCQLTWTFCSRQSNHLLNKLQERALTIIYNDYDLSFSELLEMPINPQFT